MSVQEVNKTTGETSLIAGATLWADMPVGAEVKWTGSTVPRGFLACNGGTFVQTDYPDLYAVLGSTTLPNDSGFIIKAIQIAVPADIQTALDTKQDVLTFDIVPTANSINPVTSGGIYSKQKDITDYLDETLVPEVNRLDDDKLDKTGDSKDNITAFTSSDVADGSATSWTSVTKLATGEKHSSIFAKMSQMFKNVRYLYKLLGTTDVSSFFGGSNQSVTGALATLNTNIGSHTVNKNVPSDAVFTDTWRPIVNNLTSTSTTSSLSAYQGKVLNGKITDLNNDLSNKADKKNLSNFEQDGWRWGNTSVVTNYGSKIIQIGKYLLVKIVFVTSVNIGSGYKNLGSIYIYNNGTIVTKPIKEIQYAILNSFGTSTNVVTITNDANNYITMTASSALVANTWNELFAILELA